MSSGRGASRLELTMCFGTLSFSQRCETCGYTHPQGLVQRCIELHVRDEATRLDAELERYFASPEARFFAWLARRAA